MKFNLFNLPFSVVRTFAGFLLRLRKGSFRLEMAGQTNIFIKFDTLNYIFSDSHIMLYNNRNNYVK